MHPLFFFSMFVLCFSHKTLFRKQNVSVEKLKSKISHSVLLNIVPCGSS